MTTTILLRGFKPCIRYCHQSKVAYISTGTTVDSAANFRATQGAWLSSSETNHKEKNRCIAARFAEVEKWIYDYEYTHKRFPCPTLINGLLKLKTMRSNLSIQELSAMFLKHAQTRDKSPISYSTTLNYTTFFAYLTEYAPDFNANLINSVWVSGFKKHLADKHKIASSNSISSRITQLKTFLNYLIDENLTELDRVFVKRLDDSKQERDIVAYTQDEMKLLYNADFYDRVKYPYLTDKQRYELTTSNHRHLIQCETGLRVSDLQPSKWVLSGNILQLKPHKTRNRGGAVATIPLTEECLAIMSIYKAQGGIPHMDNVTYTDMIKEAARLVEINTPVKLLHGKKRYAAGESVPKHKIVSSHTARATFICQWYESGGGLSTLSDIVGISVATIKTSYLKVSKKRISEESEAVHSKRGNLKYEVRKVG